MQISLIVATCGRREPLTALLESLVNQTISSRSFEIIIVDQNTCIDLQPLLSKFTNQLAVRHIRSSVKGLSFNRNIGLGVAKGEIVAFPDDDCCYYPETIERVLEHFSSNPDTTVLLGRIYDQRRDIDIIRSWPRKSRCVNGWNFYRLSSSITLFSRNGAAKFDSRFGVGAEYGSNEDADFVLSAIEAGALVTYDPDVTVWHAETDRSGTSLAKVRSYGIGFGAFVAKHSTVSCACLLVLSISFQLAKLTQAIIRFDWEGMKERWISAQSRLFGAIYFIRRKERDGETSAQAF